MRISKTILLAGIALASTSTAPSFAQSSAGVAAEEIIVTARKRQESIMKTPVVMSAISSKQIEDMHIQSITALTAATPNLQINIGFALAGSTVNFRGLGNGSSANFIDQSMAINIDGFTSNSGRLYRQGAFDMAQIEIMKGPQALFYGKSTSSGLIAIHSADPGASWDTKVGIGYEFEADEMDLDAYISGPITDKLGIRIAGYHNTQKGWFTNLNPANDERRVPGGEQNGGRLTLKYDDPDTGLRVKLKASFTDDKANQWYSALNQLICPTGVTLIPIYRDYAKCELSHFTQGNPQPLPYRPDLVFGNAPTPENIAAFAVGTPSPGFRDGKSYSYTKTALAILSIDYDITPEITVSSVTALDYASAGDAGANSTTTAGRNDLYGTAKESELSQEVRVTSNYKDRWYNFMFGGLYNPTTVRNHLAISLPNFRRWTDDKSVLKTETKGAFGQILLTPIDKWELSAGIRYTHIRKNFVSLYACSNLGPACRDYIGDLLKPQIDFSEDAWTPEFTLTYRPTDEVTTFLTYKHGYKGPGFNANLVVGAYTPTMSAADLSPFGGERVKGVEGGVKAQLMDRQLAITATGYLYNYRGLQVAFTDNTRNIVYISPVATARVQGLELGADYAPHAVPGLSLTAFINYNDSHYKSFPTSRCYGSQTAAQGCVGTGTTATQDVSGRTLNMAAKWVGNIGGTYRWDVNENYQASFTAGLKYSSSYLPSAELNPVGRQDAYALLDLALRFGPIDGRWELGVLCRDCNDKVYAVYGTDSGAGSSPAGFPANVAAQVARPREIMLQLTVHPWRDE